MATKKPTTKKPTKKSPPKNSAKSPQEKTSKRKYEGASKSKRLSRWVPGSLSAMAEISQSLNTLRDRSRDLRRNNPYAVRAISAIGSNVVGTGIAIHWRKENSKSTKQTLQETLYKDWAETKDCDFDGHNNLAGLQRLAMEAVAESGEVLIRRRYDYTKKFPLQYQILESDFIDTNYSVDRLGSGNFVVQGIEFNSKGQKVAYWLLESHPGSTDFNYYSGSTKSNRVPASEIRHLFRKDRPGQARGIPWLAPCIVRLKDFDDYEDAQLVRQKMAACFTAFVHDLPGEASLSDTSLAGDDEEDCDLADRVEPGMIEELPAGKTVTFGNPPSVQNYGEYTSVILRGIATGLGITYEVLTGDYSQSNYSSGRMGWIEMFRNIETWRDDVICTQWLDEVVIDFKNTAAIMGVSFNGFTWSYIKPKREMIDPTKEIPAAIMSIKGGLSTWTEEIGAKGKDVNEHFEQYKKDLDKLDTLKITVMSDARQPDGPGRPLGGVSGTGA